MKIRENELHVPKRIRVDEPDGWNRCYKICTVCNLRMLGEQDYNYCPRCGARFKDIEITYQESEVLAIPCKIGQRLFFPEITEKHADGSIETNIYEGTAVCFNIEGNCQEVYAKYDDGLTYWHSFEIFGKSVFTNKEDAKKALDAMIKEEVQ